MALSIALHLAETPPGPLGMSLAPCTFSTLSCPTGSAYCGKAGAVELQHQERYFYIASVSPVCLQSLHTLEAAIII